MNSLIAFLWRLIFRDLWRRLLQYLLTAKGKPPRPTFFGKSRLLHYLYMRTTDVFKKLPTTPWTRVIGTLKADDVRGPIMMVATQAIGWAGIVAITFAPALQAAYFRFSSCTHGTEQRIQRFRTCDSLAILRMLRQRTP